MSLEVIRHVDLHTGSKPLFQRFDALLTRLDPITEEGMYADTHTFRLDKRQLWPLQRQYDPQDPEKPDSITLHEEIEWFHDTDRERAYDMGLYDHLAEILIGRGPTMTIYSAQTFLEEKYASYDKSTKRVAHTTLTKHVVSAERAQFGLLLPSEQAGQVFNGLNPRQTKATIEKMMAYEPDPLEYQVGMNEVCKAEELAVVGLLRTISTVVKTKPSHANNITRRSGSDFWSK